LSKAAVLCSVFVKPGSSGLQCLRLLPCGVL